MITLRAATDLDVQFLIDCINKDHEINDNFYAPRQWAEKYLGIESNKINLEVLKFYLNPKFPNQDLIIVNYANKDIGFFSQDLDYQNMILGATCFTHPRACKMSILKVVKACVIRGIMYGLNNDYHAVEFNTAAGLISNLVAALIPIQKYVVLEDTYRISYMTFDRARQAIAENDFFETLKSKLNVQIYHTEKCLFSFEDNR